MVDGPCGVQETGVKDSVGLPASHSDLLETALALLAPALADPL